MSMKTVFTGKVFIGMLVVAAILSCASLVYILLVRPAAIPPNQAPAASVFTILPGPTSTARPLPPTLTPIPPTSPATPTPAPGQIAVGVYVQPSTGGDGLRIHVAPSLDSDLAFPAAAFDSEVFLVTQGPQTADGYTWWYLTASYDASRSGWAVEDYLVAIP